MEGVPKQFSSPDEEINFLREQLAEKEREIFQRVPEIDDDERTSLAKEQLKEYSQFTPKIVLDKQYQIDDLEVAANAAHLETTQDPVEDILRLAKEKGIKNALTVLEKTSNAYVIDEVHRKLVQEIHGGITYSDLKEGVPPWQVLHMTLYEVAVPAHKTEEGATIPELTGTMQQLFAGLRTIGSAKGANHFTIEIAAGNGSDDIVFYVAVPDEFKSLFEKQVHSLFPHAVLTEQANDYNVYVDNGTTQIATVGLKKFYGYPIRMAADFSSDPLAVILNAFSNIDRDGEGAAIQFVVRRPQSPQWKRIDKIIDLVEKGESVNSAVSATTTLGMVSAIFNDIFGSKTSNNDTEKSVDQESLELLKKKIATELVEVDIRLVVSAGAKDRADQIMAELSSTLNQFSLPNANEFSIKKLSGGALKKAEKAFSFRQFSSAHANPYSLEELATLIHFPEQGTVSSPQFKQSYSKTAPAPVDMPSEGTLIGINKHRGQERPIYVTEKDRMRHFYVIGQTGTGKSVFLQNLIVQDIQAGAGVCMIDPHGTDIQQVLGAIPPEREQDVIYFDPSYLERSIGLNMLEYDPSKPEQKTFIVNELLSIFKKLYGANPESMGPMFEQYFRNATMLVMEDPDSGNTLLDIGRVMSDAKFRRQKLAKATNPTVVSFWKEIATKAGGEASLENVVPYIVSKIDPLTANDYLRPIIGQQTSAFNFRQLMDERKILLVNLSKGRLGEINANLIGMIFVGKILMAALSRVDAPNDDLPPFFLHIDEFQNISTPSIAAILSEARKYKLGLTVAHQFIAQLDPTISDAVFGNVGSMAAFRVGNDDAQALESQFAPAFTANEIMNTPNYNAVMRVLANGTPTQAFSVATMPPPESDENKVRRLMEQSYATYGRARADIEEEIQVRYQKTVPGVPPAPQ